MQLHDLGQPQRDNAFCAMTLRFVRSHRVSCDCIVCRAIALCVARLQCVLQYCNGFSDIAKFESVSRLHFAICILDFAIAIVKRSAIAKRMTIANDNHETLCYRKNLNAW